MIFIFFWILQFKRSFWVKMVVLTKKKKVRIRKFMMILLEEGLRSTDNKLTHIPVFYSLLNSSTHYSCEWTRFLWAPTVAAPDNSVSLRSICLFSAGSSGQFILMIYRRREGILRKGQGVWEGRGEWLKPDLVPGM